MSPLFVVIRAKMPFPNAASFPAAPEPEGVVLPEAAGITAAGLTLLPPEPSSFPGWAEQLPPISAIKTPPNNNL
ncbi:hypothetical protein FACS1894151_03650 [Spirochaetia bacterium]|nr:hypothetical protein FACS1894151_03650 [Spirochaetia bacterium]